MARKFFSLVFVALTLLVPVRAQTAEVKISLSERFFDALLEAVFTNLEPPAFPISRRTKNDPNAATAALAEANPPANFFVSGFARKSAPQCGRAIKLQREVGGVRTAVRFRDGRIYAPIAFTGDYEAPLVGCLPFRGWAETNIELEFDRERQTLVGRARVLNVRLEGVPNLAGGVLTPLVQSAIDRRVNPMPILPLEKLSFVVPVENAGALRLRAVGVRHEIVDGALNVSIAYEFAKGN